jgi:hypothetical protein
MRAAGVVVVMVLVTSCAAGAIGTGTQPQSTGTCQATEHCWTSGASDGLDVLPIAIASVVATAAVIRISRRL